MTEKSPHVAIIILNWNGMKETLECLESVFRNTYSNYSVTVIDNASEKDELSEIKKCNLPVAHFLQNFSNLGFAEGNNIGIRKALEDGAHFIFTLNNDTVVDPNFLKEAVATALSSHAGIVATTMLQYRSRVKIDSLGHDLLSCGDTIPRGRGESYSTFLASKSCTLKPIFGACAGAALYSVDMLRKIGLFDTDFFLNYEDADLSLRSLVQGYHIVYCPKSIIYHHGSASIIKIRNAEYQIRSQRNQLFAYLHNIPLLVILLNLPAILLRDILAMVISFLLLKWQITGVLIRSRLEILYWLPTIIKKRNKVLKYQKISSWWIWKNQKSFICCVRALVRKR